MRFCLVFCVLAFLSGCQDPKPASTEKLSQYAQLVSFFQSWRTFQEPPVDNGVPDYSVEAMRMQHQQLADWRVRLQSFDTTGWPVKHQIDWYLVWAEMNGLDFDHRVLQPWVRDPAFYVWFYPEPSDVPKREGPVIFGAVDLQFYGDTISNEQVAAEVANRLRMANGVYAQARQNLTGNARDLWMTGIRSIQNQVEELGQFSRSMRGSYPDLSSAALEARAATEDFVKWLEAEAPKKNGPSGIGKDNYDWYVRHVHLMTYSWHDEMILLERELARSHSALRFAEHRNRKLPKLEKASTAEVYTKMLTDGVEDFLRFMDEEDFMTVKPYMKPAMLAQIKPFVPNQGMRGFFDEVDHRDPMPMRAHHFHWIEKEREIVEPIESPIRRAPLLYNIYDSRAEGMATAMEELIMNAGMLESRPRAKELVYIMLAQRAARGLAGLYQHGNVISYDSATKFASHWVPWGLLPADGATIQWEEQFYLRQPGYGSSYVVGKLDIDKLIAEYARQREGTFSLKEFMDTFNTVGIIPTSLVYWEMTGDKSLLEKATSDF
jgi:hypothetical protein